MAGKRYSYPESPENVAKLSSKCAYTLPKNGEAADFERAPRHKLSRDG